MQKKYLLIIVAVLCTFSSNLKAQYAKKDTTHHKFFVGTTLFLLGNLAKKNRPDYGQLNIGYRITSKDAITLELRTWKYAWPLGIHPIFNKAYSSNAEKFPGYIRDFGFAIAYQRFLWKGFYVEVNVMNSWQAFVNDKGKKIDKGFQIFNTYRIGYHIKLFKDRFFLQPSIAITTVLFILKCLMDLNSWMINGLNSYSENRDFISDLIFNFDNKEVQWT